MQSQRDAPAISAVPVPATSFIARQSELDALVALLTRPDVRLVTLTGPGGVGKTRLAIQSLASVAAATDSRVSAVSLAPIREHLLVTGTIARALGLHEQQGLSAFETLARGIGDQSWIILLDNLEQVIEIGPLLSELLGQCPGLRLLATSRVRLNIASEYQYQVRPLDLPTTIDTVSLDTSRSISSVALFVERARQVQSDFELTAENQADVLGICRKLDGLPLAIELAAARLAILSPAALHARLDHRLRLLTGGPRDQPARLQSMGDAIDWSYSLLDQREQQMLRSLAVFLGGWSIGGAAAVTGQDVETAFDLIASLNEKSLLRAIPNSDSREPRFTMLETLREFGLQLLEDQHEITQVRVAHAAYFLALAERAAPELDKDNQRAWLDLLDSEHDNFRLALDWYEQAGDADSGIRMASSLFRFWDTRDYLAEGRNRIERILALPGGITHAPAKARALEALAELSLWQGDCSASAQSYTDALSLFESIHDTLGEVRCLKGMAITAITVQDMADADRLAADIALRANLSGDSGALAASDWVHGVLNMARGNFTEAEHFMLRSLDVLDRAGDRSDAMAAMFHLAEIATVGGDLQIARDRWLDGLKRNHDVGEMWNLAWYLEGISLLLILENQTENACLLLGAAIEWRETNNSPVMRIGGIESRPNEIARERLGSEMYARLVGEGRTLTLAAAVEQSLSMLSELQFRAHPDADRADVLTGLGLTARECDVFLMLCHRLTDKEIGTALFISPRTVSTHVNAILGKLNLTSRREVAAKAAQLGIPIGHHAGTHEFTPQDP